MNHTKQVTDREQDLLFLYTYSNDISTEHFSCMVILRQKNRKQKQEFICFHISLRHDIIKRVLQIV